MSNVGYSSVTRVRKVSEVCRRDSSPLGTISFTDLSSPAGRRGAESAFEERIEQTQIAVSAFHGDLDDLGIAVAEELPGFEQAQLGLAGSGRSPEMLPE